jgi:phosphonate transport system permease protein
MTIVEQLHAHIGEQERRRRIYSGLFGLIAVILFLSSFAVAEELNSGSFIGGLQKFFNYPSEIVLGAIARGADWFPLAASYIPALIETINMAAVSTIFGGVCATVLAFCSTRNLNVWPPLIPVARRSMDIMRAFPELILALFLIYVLGTSPVPAMIAIAFHTSGALGKLFSEVNENVDDRQIEGLASVGASWTQRMRFGVIPQVLPNYLSYALLRFEINIRASAILGFVGAGGIGQELKKSISWGKGDEIAALFVILFLTIVAIDQLSSYLRRRIVGGAFHSEATGG